MADEKGGAEAEGAEVGAARGGKRPRESAPGYGNGPAYWDKRYRNDPAPFEWLKGFADLKGLVQEATAGRLDCPVLHVGCGNSLLTEAMFDAGYQDIVNIDNSSVAVEQMGERNQHLRPAMQWLEMDATQMTFEDSSFGAVIDKSVIDAFACGDNAALMVATYLKEVQRVLRPRGVFLCVSYGAPSTRIEYFRQPHLEFSVRQVVLPPTDGGSSHYAYLLRKPPVPGKAESRWPEVLRRLGGPA